MEIVIAAVVVMVGLIAGSVVLSRSRAGRHAPAAANGANGVNGDLNTEALDRRRVDLDRRASDLERRERDLDSRDRSLDGERAELERVRAEHTRALERAAGLSAGQAKHALLKEIEDQARHESARIVRQIEEETKRDAERRARWRARA
jgi:ribonucrease Y